MKDTDSKPARSPLSFVLLTVLIDTIGFGIITYGFPEASGLTSACAAAKSASRVPLAASTCVRGSTDARP